MALITTIELDDFVDQITQLTRTMARGYRLHDRDEILCHDVTVLQWETMDVMDRLGEATMNEISGAMTLANSTMTRVVDQLVGKGLAERQSDPGDRRVVRVALTTAGEETLAEVRRCIRDSQKGALSYIAIEDRATILWSLKQLLEAGEQWRKSCCGS